MRISDVFYLHVMNRLNVIHEPPATLKANNPVTTVITQLGTNVIVYNSSAFNNVKQETNRWLITT